MIPKGTSSPVMRRNFCCYLHVTLQSLTLISSSYKLFLGSFQYCEVLALEGQSLKYNFCELLAICTLYNYYDARPGCLMRTVCKNRKCIFLTGLITSLPDLLQVNHQERMVVHQKQSLQAALSHPITFLSKFSDFVFTIFPVLAGSLLADPEACMSDETDHS